MDYNAALSRVTEAYLVISAFTKVDSRIGLPCFLYCNTTFRLTLKVWCGCYNLAEEFGFSELECSFLFRWFLLGGVLDNDEIQTILGSTLKYCKDLGISRNARSALAELFRFACQQGRLGQPWEVMCLKWILLFRL
jgi:hypothetical protein